MSPDPSHIEPAEEQTPDAAVTSMKRGPLENLWRRIVLTWRYLGPRALLFRVLTFPLRFTPLKTRLGVGGRTSLRRREALRWYRASGRPVSVVIPSYGDPAVVAAAVASIRKTTKRGMVRIVVSDDASAPEHVAALRAVEGIDELVLGTENVGFAANVNRGIAAADPAHDVVVLNSDVLATRGWLACLQHAAHETDEVGIVGAKLLYPNDRIQHAGVHRNPGAPQWFDHLYRFKPGDHGLADVGGPVLAVTGACMYVRRDAIDAIGTMDERYPMAFEDVDWCLRAWSAGRGVVYEPAAVLYHLESVVRGTEVGEREQRSMDEFWARWRPFFEERDVRTPSGALRIRYVTEGTGVGGGHRDIFEHLNRLAERGHDVALYTLEEAPTWFPLEVPVHTFEDYEEMIPALAAEDAIKVATWWNSADAVWRASVVRGIPVYFVQDIETSYYPDDEVMRDRVLASYRSEFRYMTISGWNGDRLRELGRESTLIPPGIDLETFRPLEGAVRRDDMLLALGRTNPLKNLPLTLKAWKSLPEPRPELCLFGIEPELGEQHGARYVIEPPDEQVNELFNEATVFVQTSTHEGFALPPLEAMATGGAVVTTDAHGNRDFCRDGENCLMPAPEPAAVRAAIVRLLADPELRARLGEDGRRTAQDYAWPLRIDALEAFLASVADDQHRAATDAVPGA